MISGFMAAVASLFLIGRLGAAVPTMGTFGNGLTLLKGQEFYQLLATGIILIVAMLIDKLPSGSGGGK